MIDPGSGFSNPTLDRAAHGTADYARMGALARRAGGGPLNAVEGAALATPSDVPSPGGELGGLIPSIAAFWPGDNRVGAIIGPRVEGRDPPSGPNGG